MTVTLNLKPEVEAEIAQKAAAEGTGVSDYLEKMIEETVKPEPRVATPTRRHSLRKIRRRLAVLRQWREEDKTDDPEEIARRQAELGGVQKAAMNESHTSSPGHLPMSAVVILTAGQWGLLATA